MEQRVIADNRDEMFGATIGSVARGVRDFLREDYNPKVYIPVAIFLVAAIAVNYGTNFTNVVLFSLPFDLSRFGAFFLLLAAGYYLPAMLAAFMERDGAWLRSGVFWLKSASALAVLAINFSVFLLYPIVLALPIPDAILDFTLRSLVSLTSTIFVLLFLLIAKLVFDRDLPGFYGASARGAHLRPYFVMLLAVAPLIAAASFLPDFLHVYPTYRPGDAAAYLGVPDWLLAVIYETLYLFDFLFVEIFFRGILVIGMVRLMGRSAVLPMTVLYTFAHFGKPLGETIAAIIGGYILGVVAYRSRSVTGGFILHAGIAFLMEVFAALQWWRR